MIVGEINLDQTFFNFDKKIERMFSIMSWGGAQTFKKTWEGFSGYCIADKNLPLSESDFFYIDRIKNLVVVFDGYIYNKKDLALRFSPDNLNIPTPELIAIAYLANNVDFVNLLNGDFAICIYHQEENKVVLFRDHVGIRPLVFACLGSKVYFSTDPIGFCKALFQDEKIDRGFLINMFLWEGYDYFLLPNSKAKNVKPGHFSMITPEKQEEKKYWEPETIKTNKNLTQDLVLYELEELLKDSIRIRTDKKFNASTHVSSGLDSGVVAALVRKELNNQADFFGFSWSPPYEIPKTHVVYDERLLVDELCKKNDITPLYVELTEDDFFYEFKSWRHPTELVFEKKVVELAKMKNVNLLFSGWGGDEFISINNRGIDADLIRDGLFKTFFKKHPFRKPKKIIVAFFYNVFFPSFLRSYSKYKTDPTIFPYLRKTLGSNLISKNKRFRYYSRQKIHLQLLNMGHLAKRASDWYVHGQRNGIEYRYPMLDKRIIEYMLKVPSNCLVSGDNNRIILRSIGKDILPDVVLKNKSKDDPVKSYFFKTTSTEISKLLAAEIEVFRSNPNLDFVDFNLLQNDINSSLKTGDKLFGKRFYYTLYPLKSVHEFTKGYCGKT